jgi:tRNA (guanine37-N1)-methyltransferase
MRFEVITLFPELFAAFAGVGLIGRAIEHEKISIAGRSPRDYARDKHRSVDDTPFGGGSGMVMMPEPIVAAIEALTDEAQSAGLPRARRVLLGPEGTPFTQEHARRLAAVPALLLICGRYEGIDERVRSTVDETISIGDFVLNGGEVAAMAVIEAVSRLLPEVLGNAQSLAVESHGAGLLEYPQYSGTRSFRGMDVPPVLLSGNHAAIERWRRRQALVRTRSLRPDLFARLTLSDQDRALLGEHDDNGGKAGT